MPLRVEIALLAALTVSAQQRQIGQGVNFYSTEKEIALGAHLANEVRQKTTPLNSAAALDYVEGIARRFATQLADTRFTYTMAVIADDRGGHTHEPLSLPAGYIFVPANLILTAQNEAEFAGMLAHAMAHVAERHATRLATRGNLANVSSVPIILIGGWGESAEQAIPMAFLSIKRSLEIEADALAIKMASGVGYDPGALAKYIGRTQPQNRSQTSELFSGLPPRDSRIAGMEKAIQALPPKTGTYVTTDAFSKIQDEVRRLLPPTRVVQPPTLWRPNEKQ